MLNVLLILYEIFSFVFSKNYIIKEYYKSYLLYSKSFKIIICLVDSNSYCSDKKDQNNNVFFYLNRYNEKNQLLDQNYIYIVKPGDTLFRIARITGNNYLDLARNNNIKDINMLQVNQVLQINNNMKIFFLKKILNTILLPIYDSSNLKKVFFIIKKKINLFSKDRMFLKFRIKNNFSDFNNDIGKNHIQNLAYWNWPACGSIVRNFSESEGGNPGIDISGVFDQPILAATNGQVVYVGNVLKGYGNLVIIKHDNNYLSAYAHNNRILVSEQQYVKKGDQIATMGKSETNEVKLHFEIRHKGKSINPLNLLP